MNNNLLYQLKSNLGFSEKKALVFLSLLQLGETSVLKIAQKAKLKRTTVYNILPELIDDGLVATTNIRRHKRYFVTDPKIILKILESRTENTKALISSLTALHSTSLHQPKISIHEGESGARQIYEDTLNINSGDTIYGFIGDIKENPIPEKDLATYIKTRISKKIRNKVIMAPSSYANFLQEDAEQELREVKVLSKWKNLKAPGVDIKIYGHKVAIISYRENFLGIVIESRDISQMCKLIFDSLWEATKN
jgi:sugar-specific transcriptional regulator TrmB